MMSRMAYAVCQPWSLGTEHPKEYAKVGMFDYEMVAFHSANSVLSREILVAHSASEDRESEVCELSLFYQGCPHKP